MASVQKKEQGKKSTEKISERSVLYKYSPAGSRPTPMVQISPERNAIPYGKEYIQPKGYKP